MDGKLRFGTLRNAVKAHADAQAANELLDKPQMRHIRAATDSFRMIFSGDQQAGTQAVEIWAGLQELKGKMGPERFKLFDKVAKEKGAAMQSQMGKAGEQILSSDMSEAEARQAIIDLANRSMAATFREVVADPRIQTSFAGAEALLLETIAFVSQRLTPLLNKSFELQERQSI